MIAVLFALPSGVEARLALAVLFVGAVLGVGFVSRRRLRTRHERLIESTRLAPVATNRPRLLAFSGPACAACRTQQAIIDGLRERWSGGFDREVIDAAASALAGRLGIVTVPATVVVAPNGRVIAINCGLTQASRLEPQLRAALASREPADLPGADRDRDDDARGDAA